MKQYRNIQYEIFSDNFLKLYYAPGKDIESGFPNGEKFISIPKHYLNSVDLYAKIVIDRLYDWHSEWTKFETRERLK